MLNFKLNNDLKDLQNEIGEEHYRTKSFENALNKKAMILVTAFVVFDEL